MNLEGPVSPYKNKNHQDLDHDKADIWSMHVSHVSTQAPDRIQYAPKLISTAFLGASYATTHSRLHDSKDRLLHVCSWIP